MIFISRCGISVFFVVVCFLNCFLVECVGGVSLAVGGVLEAETGCGLSLVCVLGRLAGSKITFIS